MSYGPADLYVVEFAGSAEPAQVTTTLRDVTQAGIITLLDLAVDDGRKPEHVAGRTVETHEPLCTGLARPCAGSLKKVEREHEVGGRRQAQLPTVPLEQRRLHELLETFDLQADGRLRTTQGVTGLGEAAEARHGGERPQKIRLQVEHEPRRGMVPSMLADAV